MCLGSGQRQPPKGNNAEGRDPTRGPHFNFEPQPRQLDSNPPSQPSSLPFALPLLLTIKGHTILHTSDSFFLSTTGSVDL